MTGFILKVARCSPIWLDGLHFIFLCLPNGSGTTRSPGLVFKLRGHTRYDMKTKGGGIETGHQKSIDKHLTILKFTKIQKL